MEPNKCDDLKWVSFRDVPGNMTLHIRKAIEAINKKNFYGEINLAELKSEGLYML